MVRILFEEPVPIEKQRPGISASLAGLVQHLLQKEPARRPTDAGALRAALAQLGEQSEPALAVTLARPDAPPESFAEQEQRLFSIVLASPTGPARLGEAERQALLMSLRALGTSADFLANGSLIVTVSSGGSAQDQAAQAARAALLIREQWSAAAIAVATGRGVLRGRSAVGEVVERAASSLQALAETSAAPTAANILVDTLSAKLLEGRFALTLRPSGALLLYEEREMDAPHEVDQHLRESLSAALQAGNVMEALLTEIAWAEACIERGDAATARLLLQSAGARINDEMLPCTQEHFLPLIQGGLRRCGGETAG